MPVIAVIVAFGLGCGGGGSSAPNATGTHEVALGQTLTCVAGCGGDGKAGNAPHVVVPDRPAVSTVGLLEPCLSSRGLRVYGGSGAKSGGAKLPIEVGATRGEGGPGAILAVYDTADQAAGALPSITAGINQAAEKGASAAAEQHGSVTVLWIPNPPADSARTAVLGCLSKRL
jgi:hypothetical protein